jgi:hypothetical protein
MRSVQRGITTFVLIVGILGLSIAVVSAYFLFNQNKQHKISEINSFNDCAKHYPVMESYPEQCATPDGKHFTRELTEEEKQRLIPPSEPSPSVSSDETANWDTYQNSVIGLSLKYPPTWLIKEEEKGRVVNIFSPGTNENFPDINIVLTENSAHNENPDNEYMTEARAVEIAGYDATIREDQDGSLPRAGGFKYIQSVEVQYGDGYTLYLTAEKNDPTFSKILKSIKLSGLE